MSDTGHVRPSAQVFPPHKPPAQAIGDGDAIKLAGTTWRLHGIDAPGNQQTCADGWPAGWMATAHLARLMRERTTACEYTSKDRYGRAAGICKADGKDVGVHEHDCETPWA